MERKFLSDISLRDDVFNLAGVINDVRAKVCYDKDPYGEGSNGKWSKGGKGIVAGEDSGMIVK